MLPVGGLLAFSLPGGPELAILLVLGVLLFGRRLPEVGRAIGKTVADFRRGLNEFKDQIDRDDSLREARESARDIKKALDVPRVATDPKRLFQKLTDSSQSTPAASPSPGQAAPVAELDPAAPDVESPDRMETGVADSGADPTVADAAESGDSAGDTPTDSAHKRTESD